MERRLEEIATWELWNAAKTPWSKMTNGCATIGNARHYGG